MIKPRPLRKGDLIALVAPSSAVGEMDLSPTIDWLEGERYRVKVMPHVHGKWRYLAGDDTERAGDILDAFADPEVRAVIGARGGYGCARLVSLLNARRIAESRKLFMGFSDLTTLHLHFGSEGLVTVHGPMGGHIGVFTESWATESLRAVLAGGNPIVPDAPRGESVVSGAAEGVLRGGCLRLLGDSLGTPFAVRGDDAILLIEDVNEAPYRVDATLTHLLNAGVFRNCKGIVLGAMTGTDESDNGESGATWREIVQERLAPLGIPLITGFPSGHVMNHLSLPLNLRVRLDAEAGSLQYLESPCEP